jgi:cell division cycle 14
MPYFTQSSIANHNSPANANELLHNAKEIIPDRFYFTSVPFHPPQFPDLHFFSIDNVLIYCNFYSDFGPNNLAQVFRFCQILQDKFQVMFRLLKE